MPYTLVADQDAFEAVIDRAVASGDVALDTEAASFHRYHDRVYLVQLTAADQTWVIDPLPLSDLAPLGQLMGNEQVEKIFHDADYDLRLLHHQFGFTSRHHFDTRVAAQLLGEPGIGLGTLLEKYLGVKPDKRFQRADWSARPLTPPMLDYAAGDTMHLHKLRDILRTQLIEKGRLAWAEEEFLLQEEGARWEPGEDDPRESFLRFKGARALDRRGLAVLRELFVWRETLASALDRATFRILGNEAILELATHPVTTREQLAKVKGVGRELLDRRGKELLDAITRGLAVPDDELPRFERGPRRPPPDPEFDARVERLKAKRNQIAERLGLQPGVLCPNATLEAIARATPQTVEEMRGLAGLREWQRKEFGAEFLQAM